MSMSIQDLMKEAKHSRELSERKAALALVNEAATSVRLYSAPGDEAKKETDVVVPEKWSNKQKAEVWAKLKKAGIKVRQHSELAGAAQAEKSKVANALKGLL